MLEPGQCTPKPILRQVVGWVVVLPLLVSFVRLPFPFGLFLALGSIVASAYGVWLARRHASRRVTVFAWGVTLLNATSLILTGNASVLVALYWTAWLYGYPYYSNWVYWTF
ncbi:hypothetical protein EXW72_09275 [Pseudomonas sp. BCA14]|uniref:hypothetical protein n=1 Tax=unclassified Pseudomonas TaxID=196821 RepID=UPI00106E95E5|nr:MULTISPECIES: hypothetical protein [unclassified Pseudomonas]TFF09118.1 hypothetical protein EXW71_18315 [Pseudomonas sp. BCA17]TFF09512.1 hypothetical protein EXW70_10775 [Pseudomonas sp. JMN1]TFF28431.1 hypothetical protein EXW72_09275 [Pseudomonas sp. BCA14]TFF29254.1 hypothetical protein EXW73_08530 [Pseudomonas sp. BCA13]